MKITIPSLIVLLLMTLGCSQDKRTMDWQEDIDYLTARLEIMHPNLYANISKESFTEYATKLKQSISGSNDIEMRMGVMELVARIRNVHVFLDKDDEPREVYQYYPVKLYHFKDGLFVSSARDKYKNIIGKEVLKIGGMTAKETMSELARFIQADNKMTTLDLMTRGFFNDAQLLKYIGACDSPNKITLKLANHDGSDFDFEIESSSQIPNELMRPYIVSNDSIFSLNDNSINSKPLYLKYVSNKYWFEYLPQHEAIYLQINGLMHKKDESFDKFCQRMFYTLDQKKAKRLIIDLRFNTGGNHIELPLVKGILSRPYLDKSDRLFLITGRTTVSAAQHLSSTLEWYTNATLFGESTSSKPNQYGAIRRFNLPNSQLAIACGVDYYQDAQPFDFSMASEPNYFVSPTSVDFRNNHDPVIEAIITYDSYKQMRPDFTVKLSAAYTKSGLAELKKIYFAIKPDLAEKGFNFENLLYDDLDSWMYDNKKDTDDYIAYLKFVYAELPNSLKVIYDLAYWTEVYGSKEEAKSLYKKCLELNPDHHYAKMKLGLMQLDASVM